MQQTQLRHDNSVLGGENLDEKARFVDISASGTLENGNWGQLPHRCGWRPDSTRL